MADGDDDDAFPLVLGTSGLLNYDEKIAEYKETLESCPEKGGWRSTGLADGSKGWLSYRMMGLLRATAEINSEDCCGDEYYRRYMPETAREHEDGFQEVMGKIAETIRRGGHPTTENVRKTIYGHYSEWEYRGIAKNYFDCGGRIEHAIDGVLKMAKISVDDGEFEETFGEDYIDKPITPFDEDYDLVRVMCLDRRCFEANSNKKEISASHGYRTSFFDDYNAPYRPYAN